MKCQSIIKTCRKCGEKNVSRSKTCAYCNADMICGRDSISGYATCSNHGGPVPSRKFFGKGTLKTGMASSFPLVRLAAKYNQMIKDGRLISNRAAIDVIDHRLEQLLGRVDIEEAPERLKKLSQLWNDYKRADILGLEVERLKLKNELDLEFDKVYHDYMAWEQIFAAVDLRGKTVEREIKILKEIKAVITYEDAYELAAKLMSVMLRILGDDPKKLKEAQYEFAKVIGESSDTVRKGSAGPDGDFGDADGGEEGPGNVDQTELPHTRDEKPS